MDNTTYYQKNGEKTLNKAKDYYKNNNERLREQARNKYKNLSEEDKKREYGKNRYRNMPEKKKQKLKENQDIKKQNSLRIVCTIYQYTIKPIYLDKLTEIKV